MQKTSITLPHSFRQILSFGLGISLSFNLISPVYASPIGDEIENLIREDLFRHQEEIQAKSFQIDLAERQLIYQLNQKNLVTGSLLNLLPIFGYGSYQQGDLVGGISLSIFDGIGYAALIAALLTPHSPSGYGGLLLGGVSLISFGLGRIVGVASPFIHGSLYNTTLKQSLNAWTEPVSLTPAGLNNYPLLAFEHQF